MRHYPRLSRRLTQWTLCCGAIFATSCRTTGNTSNNEIKDISPTPVHDAGANYGQTVVCATAALGGGSSAACATAAQALAAQGVKDPLTLSRKLCDQAPSFNPRSDAAAITAACYQQTLPVIPNAAAATQQQGDKICNVVAAVYQTPTNADDLSSYCQAGIQQSLQNSDNAPTMALTICQTVLETISAAHVELSSNSNLVNCYRTALGPA